MSNGGKPALRTKTAVIAGLTALFVVAVAGAILWYNKQLVCCGGTKNNGNKAGTTIEVDASKWPKYVSYQFGLVVAYPPGMNTCDDLDSAGVLVGLSVRNDACDATTRPSFRFRINDAWRSLDAVASFNDAYGQQLKEAGLTSVADHGTVVTGTTTSSLIYNVSTTVTGTIVYVPSSGTDVTKRKVAVDIYRDVPPVAPTVAATADQITEAVLRNISLALPKPKKQEPVSQWKTATVEQGNFSINYPSSASTYNAAPNAALAVAFNSGARLEVRYGTSVDSTKGDFSNYKKLTEKSISVNGTPVIEDRYVLMANETAAERLLFVSFSKGTGVVGVSFTFKGDPTDETSFETILNSFKFL